MDHLRVFWLLGPGGDMLVVMANALSQCHDFRLFSICPRLYDHDTQSRDECIIWRWGASDFVPSREADTFLVRFSVDILEKRIKFYSTE